MKACYLLAMTVALSVSTSTLAADNKEPAIFKEGNCNNCHNLSETTVGPSLIQIADKYRDDKEAQEKLEKKVRTGGSGSWGVMPMPGTRQSISDADIKILVAWILEQKAKPKADVKTDAKSEKKTK
ncbi:MAG: c-type cytochrome [Pseudomonadota bacterium]